MTSCRSCQAPIVWARTGRGRAMPLDRERNPNGNVVMRDGVATVLAGDALQEARVSGEPIFMSHFASCPNAGTAVAELQEVPKVVQLADGEQCMACPEPGDHAVVVLGLIVGYACAECADHAQLVVER